jgi:protein TonB
MHKILLILLLLISGTAFSQQLTEMDPKKDDTYISVEEMPVFPGGNDSLMTFIRRILKYPQHASVNAIEGKVLVGFIVDKSGKVRDVELKRSSGNKSLDDEALRVVRSMPIWKPGIQDDKPVNVSYVLPLVFRLEP